MAFKATSKNYLISIKVNRTSEAMDYKSFAKISDILQYEDEARLNAVLRILIVENIVELTSVFGGLNDKQVKAISEMLFDEFKFWTVADVKLCFVRALKGFYGEVKRVDFPVVYSWCKRYNAQRTKAARRIREQKEEQEQKTKEDTTTFIPDYFSPLITRLNKGKGKTSSSRTLRQKFSVPEKGK